MNLAEQIKEAQEKFLIELHYYAKWILENPDATPLERRARKNEHADLMRVVLTETRKKFLEEEIKKLKNSQVTEILPGLKMYNQAINDQISRLDAELKELV